MPFTTTRRVQFRDTDAAGIMHFSTFFTYMEQAEHEMLRSLGLSVAMHEGEITYSWPRVSTTCDFKQSLKFEDVFDICVRVERLGGKSVTYGFDFLVGDNVIACGKMTAVYCRFEQGQPPKSLEIPAELREKLATLAD